MIDTLVSIGCSHMYGSECKGTTFAGHVANEFGLKHIDLSVPGGGNTYIREKATEHLAENENNNCLYLIGWTTFSRHYFYFENEDGEEDTYHWAQGVDPEPASNIIGTDVKLLFDYFSLYLTNDMHGRKKRISETVALGKVFESTNTPYVMMTSCSEWMKEDFDNGNPYVGNRYKKFVNWNNYFDPYDSFVNKMMQKHSKNFSPTLHGDKFVHDWYSNGLKKFVRELYFRDYKNE